MSSFALESVWICGNCFPLQSPPMRHRESVQVFLMKKLIPRATYKLLRKKPSNGGRPETKTKIFLRQYLWVLIAREPKEPSNTWWSASANSQRFLRVFGPDSRLQTLLLSRYIRYLHVIKCHRTLFVEKTKTIPGLKIMITPAIIILMKWRGSFLEEMGQLTVRLITCVFVDTSV